MKIKVDINVLVDVLQKRNPFFSASAKICELIHSRIVAGVVPSHAVTTVFYLVEKCAKRHAAVVALDWMLSLFDMVPEDKEIFSLAKTVGFRDFEDAVVAADAQKSGCDFFVTRNIADFALSPFKAVIPEEMLEIAE